MDYALLCSYTHPEAPREELNLITDWYVWVFFFDDHFLEVFKRTGDQAGGKEYLRRLPAFMPINRTRVPRRRPTRSSGAWPTCGRERFPQSPSTGACDSSRAPAICSRSPSGSSPTSTTGASRIPIEYIEMRRKVGGAPWSADLVEHAVFVEVPARIAGTRARCGC